MTPDHAAAPPPAPARAAPDIAAAIRREFQRVLLERTAQLPAQDPVLDSLFEAMAGQLARVYAEAEQVFPEAVFDDLVAGLGEPPRPAVPAQTVVQVLGVAGPERLAADAAFVAYTPQAERVLFTVDTPVTVSPTRLSFAGVVEGGCLHAVAGATIPGDAALPLLPGRVALDPRWRAHAPALLLAFEPGPGGLAGHGLFVDAGDGDGPAARALGRSVWHLLDERGLAHAGGVLRAREGPGGVRLLALEANFWRQAAVDVAMGARDTRVDAPAARGPFGPACWVFPEALPPALRALGRPPRAVAAALPGLLPPEQRAAYDRPLAWVQVQLPAEAAGMADAVRRVAVNCVSASNLAAHAERVAFGAVGDPVTHAVRLPPGRHVVRVLGVDGEQGRAYAEAPADAADELPRAAYRARGDAVRIRPARGNTGRFDRLGTVHVVVTDGARANAVGPGDLRQFATAPASPTAEAVNLTPARGGAAPPPAAPARLRFAELVRTRERVVTPADVDVTARTFDPRVAGTAVAPRVELDDAGRAGRVDVVHVAVRPADFDDPGADYVRLAAGLADRLAGRSGPTARLRVQVEELAE